jgi:hypothetical protein
VIPHDTAKMASENETVSRSWGIKSGIHKQEHESQYREFPFKLALVTKFPEQYIVVAMKIGEVILNNTDGLSIDVDLFRVRHNNGIRRSKEASNAGLECIPLNIYLVAKLPPVPWMKRIYRGINRR